jgi:hypothetical protein
MSVSMNSKAKLPTLPGTRAESKQESRANYFMKKAEQLRLKQERIKKARVIDDLLRTQLKSEESQRLLIAQKLNQIEKLTVNFSVTENKIVALNEKIERKNKSQLMKQNISV